MEVVIVIVNGCCKLWLIGREFIGVFKDEIKVVGLFLRDYKGI